MSGWGDCNAQNFENWGSATTSGSAVNSASWNIKPVAPIAATAAVASGRRNASPSRSIVNNYNNTQSNDAAATTTTLAASNGSGDNFSVTANSGSGDNSSVENDGCGNNSALAAATLSSNSINGGWNNGGFNSPAAEINKSDYRGSDRYHDNAPSTSTGGYQRSQPGSGGYQRAFEPHERPGRSRRPTYESNSPVPYNSSSALVAGAGSTVVEGGEKRPRGPRKIMGISIDEFPSATTMLDPIGSPHEPRNASGSSSDGYSRHRNYSTSASANSWESIPMKNEAPAVIRGCNATSSGWGEPARVELTTQGASSADACWTAPTTTTSNTQPVVEAKPVTPSSSGWDNTALSATGRWDNALESSSTFTAIPTTTEACANSDSPRSFIISASSAGPSKPLDWQTMSNTSTAPVSTSSSAPIATTTPTFIIAPAATSEGNPYANAKLPPNSSWATCPFCHHCFVYPPVPTNNGHGAKN